MRLTDLLMEARTEEGRELEQAIANALKKVFKGQYIAKIQKKIGDDIVIKKKDFGNKNAVAYTKGRTIYVNETVFDKMEMKDKVRYLLHEFIHIMQNTRNFMVVRSFKEVYDLADKLWPVVKKNLTKPLAVFLTGRNQSLGTNERYLKYELISYLMNGQIRWSALTDKGRQQFIEILREENIFNLNSDFWIKRLRKK